ncbi:MAG: peptidase caspase catalytic subunit p20 [Geobacteraceae bacterium]|nr:peptidase caspase catalytic subunit p20 [Geobacteraceae bacterium]
MAKKALLVGINDYGEINDLNGCVNDVNNMRDILLKYCDFRVSDIRVLVDRRATRENILSLLGWLVLGAKKGDTLVFHYSGHGTQIRDRDGDELQDHKDEAICPADTNWDGGLILDDDLYEIFQSVKAGVSTEIILDSCFSGTGTRESVTLKDMNIRYLRPPVDREYREKEGLEVTGFGMKAKLKSLNHVLWTGCRSSQTSADALIGTTFNGAFTYYFCKHIRDVQGKISRTELIKRVRASLKYEGYSQVPQLESPDPATRKKNVFQQ